MKKKRYVLHIILAFILGIVISATVTIKACTSIFSEENFLERPSYDIINTLALLEKLRNNEVDQAIKSVEWDLDQHILEISFYITPESRNQISPRVKNSLKQAKLYRSEYPSTIKIPELKACVNQTIGLPYSEPESSNN